MFDQSNTRSSLQPLKFITAVTIGAALILLSGLSLTGAVIVLVVATPLLVLFSPILVPAGIVTFLVTTGFFFSGGCGMAAVTSLLWVYNYVTGKHPPGADRLDSMMERLANRAKQTQHRAEMYGQPRKRAMIGL